MSAVPSIELLVTSLRGGLPTGVATALAQGTGLDERAVQRLVALWLAGSDDRTRDIQTKQYRAGRVGIVAPGNLFIATWQLVIEVLSLGGRARVRASGRDRASVAVLQALLAGVGSPWAEAIDITHFDRDDDDAWSAFVTGLDAVVAQGSDAAMAAVQERVSRLRPGLPLRRHGHRLSWIFATQADASDPATADAIAHDVLLADGRGCMAPRAVLIAGELSRTAAEGLRAALTRQAKRLPKGQLPATLAATQRAWIEQARFDAALDGRPFEALLRPDFGLVVIGGSAPSELSARDLGPGGRLLVVRPAPSSLTGLATLALHTSTVALGPEAAAQAALGGGLTLHQLGVRRRCAVGEMQAPSWATTSDGEPLGAGISRAISASS